MSDSDEDALLGVVPTDPHLHPDPRPYDHASHAVDVALTQTRDKLAALRAQRDEINAEVRQLVTEQELLERMARIVRAREADGG